MFTIDILPGGMFDSNAYVLCSNNRAVLIDAGVSAETVGKVLEQRNAKLDYIIPTHGHIDHIINIDHIKAELGGKVLVFKDETICFTDATANLSAMMGMIKTFQQPDVVLEENDIVEFGNEQLQIIWTPGHSAGGICLKIKNVLFSGDTLFRNSIGRYDFRDSNKDDLLRSIREKLLVLEDDTIVYPGHGESTTIGEEKINNPYL